MQRLTIGFASILFSATTLWNAAWSAEKPTAEQLEFFEKKIRPVLVKHCYECHSSETDPDEVGGTLLLDSPQGMRKGGETGPAVVPGEVAKSLIIESLEYKSLEMPPDGKLPDEVIADFRRWVKMGAPDPRKAKTPEWMDEEKTESPAESDLWSLQPLADPAVPQIANDTWSKTEIDRFIVAAQQGRGVNRVRNAAPRELLRRVYFDLIGLPPTPEQVAEFEAHPSEEAFERVVDELLASPRYGERWGRHWLDVARYAESNGKSRDVLMPHAWRYRDYVIDAVNADVPFDRFVKEQIAGDLLPAEDDAERTRLQVATGFLAVGSKPLVGGNLKMDVADDQLDVIGKSFLGLAIGCARCHDHKFDPIPTKDYYSLAGIFTSTETLYGGGLQGNKKGADPTKHLLVVGENAEQKLKEYREHQKRRQDLTKERNKLRKQLPKLKKRADAEKKQAEKEEREPDADILKKHENAQTQLKEVEAQLKELGKQKVPELELAIGVRDDNKPSDIKVLIRGERNKKGELAPRGFLSCVEIDDPPQVDEQQSGRLQFAEWIVHPDNPLTPRVAANRIWQHLFGRGIVPTVDNFGVNGQPPTHPELLDYLASRFIEDGWSTKRLIRRIVLSRVYRLSTDFDEQSYASDPGNELYWRMNRRRLEAEALRDAMLAASGELVLERPHSSAVAEIGNGEVGRGINTKPLDRHFPHRSVYLPIIRGIVPEMLKVFDFPEPSNPQGQRDVSNVPAQSLYLMNSDFVTERARTLANRLHDSTGDDEARVRLAFRICFSRNPTDAELARGLAFVEKPSTAQGNEKNNESRMERWTTFCQALFATSEFRFVN